MDSHNNNPFKQIISIMMFHKDTQWVNQFKEDINNNRCMFNLNNTNLKIHKCINNHMVKPLPCTNNSIFL